MTKSKALRIGAPNGALNSSDNKTKIKRPDNMGLASCKKCVEKCVEMQTNPFVSGANCKRMDKCSLNTVAYQSRFRKTVTTDANGKAAHLIIAAADNTFGSTTITGSSGGAWSYVDDPSQASLATAFADLRVVSAGIRVYSIVAPTAASGVVGIIGSRYMPDSTLDISSLNYPRVLVKSLYEYDNYATFQRLNEADGFVGVGSAATDYETLTVFIDGGPVSSDVAVIEVVLNYELIPIADNFLARLATPSAKHVPQIESMAHNSSAIIPLENPSVGAVTSHVTKVVREHTSGWTAKEWIDLGLEVGSFAMALF